MLKITKIERPDAATLQLGEVTRMNSVARELLAEIYKRTGAEFIANTPMIKYFAEEAKHGIEHEHEEGE